MPADRGGRPGRRQLPTAPRGHPGPFALGRSSSATPANTSISPDWATAPRLRTERPTIGYYGAIAEWFDAPLVARLAAMRPEWRFELIGSTLGGNVRPLEGLANVRLLGECPYAELPGRIDGWDAFIIPFRRLPLTEATNPVKVYEMLATGRPVVAVGLPELVPIARKGLIRLAATAEPFAAAIEARVVRGRSRPAAGAPRLREAQHLGGPPPPAGRRDRGHPPRTGRMSHARASATILCTIGTRPEAIKMAPVIRAFRAAPWARCRVLLTAQHRELVNPMLAILRHRARHRPRHHAAGPVAGRADQPDAARGPRRHRARAARHGPGPGRHDHRVRHGAGELLPAASPSPTSRPACAPAGSTPRSPRRPTASSRDT